MEWKTQYFLFENGDLYNANAHRISQGSKQWILLENH